MPEDIEERQRESTNLWSDLMPQYVCHGQIYSHPTVLCPNLVISGLDGLVSEMPRSDWRSDNVSNQLSAANEIKKKLIVPHED